MTRPTLEPTETIENEGTVHERLVRRHPAFAQVGASRVSGGAHLYGSDFQHQHYVSLTISTSEVHRHLSNEWYHGGRELIEVLLSESQWAQMISSMNVGSGTPCTINHHYGAGVKVMPYLAKPEDKRDRFAAEMAEDMQDAQDHLAKLIEAIGGTKLSQKQKDELISSAKAASSSISGSARFVAEQFDEHMEETVERAKTEINTYVARTVTAVGLRELAKLAGNDAPPLQLSIGMADEDL